MRKATSSEGEYLPCSIAAIVWRVTPTRSPSSPCVISPARKRSVRMSLAKGGLAMPAPPIARKDDRMAHRHGDYQREQRRVDEPDAGIDEGQDDHAQKQYDTQTIGRAERGARLSRMSEQ